MRRLALALAPAFAHAAPLLPPPMPPAAAQAPFIAAADPTIAFTHARLIDGTGAPPQEGRTLLIDHGRIAAILPDGSPLPPKAHMIDAVGETLLPGLVGLHNHLYYIARPAPNDPTAPLLVPQMTFSAPRLYLAGGVTTMRTTGSVEPYADLNIKQAIDSGRMPGPHIDVTGPYLEGPGSRFIQMYALKDADDARETVAYWADRGVTSFKAYMNITRAELAAAIAEAHRRGLKVTGHLCSVTYAEAAALGIDDLEHGFFANTGNDPGKQPDICPDTIGLPTLLGMDPAGADAAALIRTLVQAHVAITSTLPVFEGAFAREHFVPPAKMLDAMDPGARATLQAALKTPNRMPPDKARVLLAHDMALERQFAEAGGLLLAGPDPTGLGNVVPGFGDQRGIELLVQAGFTPLEAIRIATLNGATYLGAAREIGSIEPGKRADLMLVDGNPAARIADIENVKFVVKDGVVYDSAKLLASVRGAYGRY